MNFRYIFILILLFTGLIEISIGSSVLSFNTPIITSTNLTSYNWAGYVAVPKINTINSIIGSWIVQPASPTIFASLSAQWVGIGGWNNQNLIQIGTSSNYELGSSYYAWYELLPNYSVQITNMSIMPNDVIYANITLIPNTINSWNMSLIDKTSNQMFSKIVNYNSLRNSAEWVDEAPSGCIIYIFEYCAFPFNLSSFGNAYFGEKYTDINNTDFANLSGKLQNIGNLSFNSSIYRIIMINNNGIIIPSNLSEDGSSFTINSSIQSFTLINQSDNISTTSSTTSTSVETTSSINSTIIINPLNLTNSTTVNTTTTIFTTTMNTTVSTTTIDPQSNSSINSSSTTTINLTTSSTSSSTSSTTLNTTSSTTSSSYSTSSSSTILSFSNSNSTTTSSTTSSSSSTSLSTTSSSTVSSSTSIDKNQSSNITDTNSITLTDSIVSTNASTNSIKSLVNTSNEISPTNKKIVEPNNGNKTIIMIGVGIVCSLIGYLILKPALR